MTISMTLTIYLLEASKLKESLPLGVQFNDAHVLQLLKNVTSNSTTALAEMRRAATIPLAPTINPLKGTNTKSSSQVDLSCHGS